MIFNLRTEEIEVKTELGEVALSSIKDVLMDGNANVTIKDVIKPIDDLNQSDYILEIFNVVDDKPIWIRCSIRAGDVDEMIRRLELSIAKLINQ